MPKIVLISSPFPKNAVRYKGISQYNILGDDRNEENLFMNKTGLVQFTEKKHKVNAGFYRFSFCSSIKKLRKNSQKSCSFNTF